LNFLEKFRYIKYKFGGLVLNVGVAFRYIKYKVGCVVIGILALLALGIGWLSVLIPCYIVGGQIIEYLKLGIWTPHSALLIFAYINPEWVNTPSTWIGLHVVLGMIPSSILIFITLQFVSVFSSSKLKELATDFDESNREFWDNTFVKKIR
jgi:hypothetical protein